MPIAKISKMVGEKLSFVTNGKCIAHLFDLCFIFTIDKYSKEVVLIALQLPKKLSSFSAAVHMLLFLYKVGFHALTTSV